MSFNASPFPTIRRAGSGTSVRSRHPAAVSRSPFLKASMNVRNIAYGDRKSAGTSPASFPRPAASSRCQRNSRILGKSWSVLPSKSQRPSAIRRSVSLTSLPSPIVQSGPSARSGITAVGMFVDRRTNSSANAMRPPSRRSGGIPERSRQATASSIRCGSSSARFIAIRKVRTVARGERNRGSTDAAAAARAGGTPGVPPFGVTS